ncbi:MAG: DNA polymerase I [Fibrobacter sp.]|nr:DNA polymerase I [Fibrobacter sp.]
MLKKRLFLLDSFALAFRMFYAYSKNPLINSKGLQVSMVHGYWGALLRILNEHQPSHFAVVCDSKGPNFRHDLYPDYKANRGPKPEEMELQLPLLEESLRLSGLAVISEPGFEADDLMASVAVAAEKAGFDEVFIISKDKDMAQIVSETIHLFHLEKGADGIDFGPNEVLEKYGVPPSQMRDYLALMGDASDNIPGVPKVGPKTATQLLKDFKSIDDLYENLDKIPQKKLKENLMLHKENAFLSRELVTLQSTRGFSGSLEQLEYKGLCNSDLIELFETHELKSLIRLLKPICDRDEEIAKEVQEDIDYVLVDSMEKWSELQADLSSKTFIAVDTETDSRSPMTANLVGLSLCVHVSKAYYIPLGHTDELGLKHGNFDFELVKNWFRDLWSSTNIEWLFYNAKFDLHVLSRAFDLKAHATVLDALIASWMLSPGEIGLSLNQQVHRYLKHEMITIESLIGRGKNQISFSRVPVAEAFVYGAEDALFTFRLWEYLKPKLDERDYMPFFLNQEMPFLKVLLSMEQKGVSIDVAGLNQLSKEMDLQLNSLEKEIFELASGKEFNIASPKQLSEVLFDDLALPVIKKTATGRSTDSSVLEELRTIAPHPIIFAIIEYREVKKLLSTYVSVLPKLVNKETNRLHTSFLQWGTATGRLSSREPNLQNIPIRSTAGKKIRASFISSNKENVLLSVDYSQIELRMLAHLSQDPKLMEAYHSGADIHAQTASVIFDKAMESVTEDMRRDAKVVNFGVLYGMTAFRLSRDLKISMSLAKEFIDGYFSLYQGVQRFIDDTIDFARTNGFVTTITGRRRYIPGIDSSDRTERQMAERMAVNTPVQGSAADLIKLAMISIHERIQKENLPLKMMLQVHDELLFECPLEEIEKLSTIVKEEMESAMTLSVPLIASVGYASNWLDAH